MSASPRNAYRSEEWGTLNATSSSGSNVEKSGYVMVFDMDETIAYPDAAGEPIFNPKIIDILQRCVEARRKKSVAAIFLYTNNSSRGYIFDVKQRLQSQYGIVFDDTMDANDPRRDVRTGPKTLVDIEAMCLDNGVSVYDLPRRVYFFDDQRHPDLFEKLGTNYIFINPPFDAQANVSSYSNLNRKLPAMGGRRRKRHTRRKSKRNTRK